MKKIIFIVVILIIIVIVGVSLSFKSTNYTANPVNNSGVTSVDNTNTPASSPAAVAVATTSNPSISAPAQLMTATNQLFSQTRDSSRAYKFFPTKDVRANAALAGYKVSTTDLGNGVTKVALTPTDPNYQAQSFIVGPGQSVYIVEKSFGDDSSKTDYEYGDDYGVAVDASGYILK